jgi:GDP-L-fucose synthase
MMFKNKNVLVAGGSGLIGRQLVLLLQELGAKVTVADLKTFDISNVKFLNINLMNYENCLESCHGIDYVFNLLCAKGSPKVMKEKPASHFDPMLLFNTNLMRAARECGVEKYLYASTLGVYAPSKVFHEDDVWKTHPSKNDRFAGWAKRMGELQAEAYQIEYGWDDISIVRPANTYGPYDDFESDGAMVVPSLIKKALSGVSPLVVWGDGTNIRDFIHSTDVARGMIITMQSSPGPFYPINIGSGTGYSIRELVEVILSNVDDPPDVLWDETKITGDKIRVLDTERAKSIGFVPSISLEDGIKDLVKWYKEHKIVK